MAKLTKEEDLLDIGFRKQIIDEIQGQENQSRKGSMFKRHDIYRDNTKRYVAEVIECEQGREAIEEIQYRVSNLSFLKTIIDKKAMIYGNGATRLVVGDYEEETKEETQEQIDKIVRLLNFNTQMKKANRWEELFKNSIIQVYPYKNDITKKWRIKLDLVLPYKIDVIEDENNTEDMRACVYSYYCPQDNSLSYAPVGQSGVHTGLTSPLDDRFRRGDGINQAIADSPADKDKRNYIWWSTKYHFTTDEKGQYIENSEIQNDKLNPVQDLPFVNISTTQDGNFWAVGGEDIVDGAVLINLFLTEIYYIAKYQGMGLFYFFGRGVPKRIKVGPSQALTHDVKPDDPTPQVGFATSNPNIAEYMNSIKEYISALLKTNKLEPSTIIGMENALQASSGIQELIQKSELNETLEDKREIYRDCEPIIFKKYIKWHNYLYERNLLDDEFAEIGLIDENVKIVTVFKEPQAVLTEKEKLEIIQTRMDMGLDTLVDAIARDNPELSKEDAKEKAIETLRNKALEARERVLNMVKKPEIKVKEEPMKEPAMDNEEEGMMNE